MTQILGSLPTSEKVVMLALTYRSALGAADVTSSAEFSSGKNPKWPALMPKLSSKLETRSICAVQYKQGVNSA
jgi:hypothetical protein